MAYDYTQDPTYQSIYKSMLGNTGAGGFKWNPSNTSSWLNQFGTDFQNTMQQDAGRDPTQQDFSNFYKQVVQGSLNSPSGAFGTSPSDAMAATQSYVPSAFSGQIKDFQNQQAQSQAQQLTQQENQALQGNISTLKGALPDVTQSLTDYYTKGPGMEQLQGAMNDKGLLNSGAFSQGLGNEIGGQLSGITANALQGLINPALSQMQGNSQQAFTQAAGGVGGINSLGVQQQGMLGDRNAQMTDFMMQADLAKQLGEDSKPSGFQSAMGMASSMLGGLGNAASGGAQAYKATPSYVCREMIKRGLLCDTDLEDFYLHLFPAIKLKARAFWHYALRGQQLVDEANKLIPDWPRTFKPLVFDRVMKEPDPVKAVDLYGEALRVLTQLVNPSLWDERVMRTSLIDSIPFLPRLFMCKTYRKNFWRILRIKTMLFYDRPRCLRHYL